MKTEKELNASKIIETLDLLIKIQNSGIATVFFNLSGHISGIEIDIHVPEWKAGKEPDYSERLYPHDIVKKIDGIHKILKNIIEKGTSAIPGLVEKKLIEIERKKRLIIQLKSELGEVAP